MKTFMRSMAVGTALSAVMMTAASAETRITYKSAKTGSSYYQMGVELAEAVKRGTDGDVIMTIEESQGSVQNVMEVRARGGDYVFTTPPSLATAAAAATGPFADKGHENFSEIRALFPIPSLTMHFVMSAETGATKLADIEGTSVLLGKGSFGATEGEKYIDLFGLAGKVEIADAELSNAVAALKNGQIDGFVTAGSWPAPNVIEAAASTPVTVLSMSEEEIAKTGRTAMTIPAGTYAGQSADIHTTSLPVMAFTTTAMDEDTAYLLTKTFWESKAEMAGVAPWWDGVNVDMLNQDGLAFHPGAVRYYDEQGIALPAAN